MKPVVEMKTFDIESQDVLPLHDYQKVLLERMSNGFKAGEMTLFTSGRGTGKSHFQQMYLQNFYKIFGSDEVKMIKPFKNVTHADVDGETWHTVSCNHEVSTWIRSQNKQNWHEHPKTSFMYSGMFDVNEKIYTLMRVGFSA